MGHLWFVQVLLVDPTKVLLLARKEAKKVDQFIEVKLLLEQ